MADENGLSVRVGYVPSFIPGLNETHVNYLGSHGPTYAADDIKLAVGFWHNYDGLFLEGGLEGTLRLWATRDKALSAYGQKPMSGNLDAYGALDKFWGIYGVGLRLNLGASFMSDNQPWDVNLALPYRFENNVFGHFSFEVTPIEFKIADRVVLGLSYIGNVSFGTLGVSGPNDTTLNTMSFKTYDHGVLASLKVLIDLF